MFVNIDVLCVAERNREFVELFVGTQGSCTNVVLGEGTGATAPVVRCWP